MGDHMQEQRKPDIRCPWCGSLAYKSHAKDAEDDLVPGFLKKWRCRKVPTHVFYLEVSQ